jgi:hypothetical protein
VDSKRNISAYFNFADKKPEEHSVLHSYTKLRCSLSQCHHYDSFLFGPEVLAKTSETQRVTTIDLYLWVATGLHFDGSQLVLDILRITWDEDKNGRMDWMHVWTTRGLTGWMGSWACYMDLSRTGWKADVWITWKEWRAGCTYKWSEGGRSGWIGDGERTERMSKMQVGSVGCCVNRWTEGGKSGWTDGRNVV